jgi:hypothetical protein
MDTRQDQAGTREPAGLTIAFVAAAAAMSVGLRLVPRLYSFSPVAAVIWNLAPVGALGLFAGSRLRWYWACLVPVLAMLAADLLLMRPLAAMGQPAFHDGTLVVYASMALYALIGRGVGRSGSPVRIAAGSLLGSTQFFLLTNFVFFYGQSSIYPRTLAGLAECYYMGLEFFGKTLAGDLLYAGLFFGTYAALLHLPQREKASQPV